MDNMDDILSDYWTRTTPYERLTTWQKVQCGCISFVAVAIAALIIIVLASCTTTRTVTVTETHTDTLYISKQQRDSIFLHDSVHVTEKQLGDTFYVEVVKWHTKIREKEIHDTLYQSRVDSFPVPYPFPEYVEKPLSWWQKTRIHLGEALLAIIVILILYNIYRLKSKRLL